MSNEINKKFHKLCDGCICELLNVSEVMISQNVFHNNICSIHYKYCKKNFNEKELYEKKGRNFFMDLVEYNIIKHKIRNATIYFLIQYLINYFGNEYI